jgi:hypothetical protein
MSALAPELEKLSGGKPYLVVVRPTYASLNRYTNVYRDAYRKALIPSLLELAADQQDTIAGTIPNTAESPAEQAEIAGIYNENGGRYSKEYIRATIEIAEDQADAAMVNLQKKITEDGQGFLSESDSEGKTTSELTYFMSNAPGFGNMVGLDGVKHGATLISNNGDLDRFYSNKLEGFAKYANGIDYIFFDGVSLPDSSVLEHPDRALIRLAAMDNGDYADLANLLHGQRKEQYEVFNFLPHDAKSAKAWGFDPYKAQLYADGGERLLKKLARAGIHVSEMSGSSASIVDLIEAQVASGRRPIIIGEASDDGRSVRIPGSDFTFEPSQLSRKARSIAWFLFCNSSNVSVPNMGFTVVGRIQLNTATHLIASLASDEERTINSKGDVNGSQAEWVEALLSLMPEANSAPGTSNKIVDVYQLTTPVSPTTVTSISTGTELFLYGAFGGLCSEFLRWRALLTRPQRKSFRIMRYILLSVGLVLLAGGAGFVFGRAGGTDVERTIIAFVAGGGFEELMKRTSRLKIWSPDIHLGPYGYAQDDDTTLLEFMRG